MKGAADKRTVNTAFLTKKLHWLLSVSIIDNSIFTYKIKEINQKNGHDVRELSLEKTGFQASIGRFWAEHLEEQS